MNLDITEIQSHDPEKITLAKAIAAFTEVGKPLVVCDHSWAIPALNGFPGGYMKDINEWFEADDFLALMARKKDRRIILTEYIVYISNDGNQLFSEAFPAHIIDEARGVGHVPGERVTVFDDETQTIAERIDQGGHVRNMERSPWHKFARWYLDQGIKNTESM